MSISAKDLVSWANNYTSRFTLPKLLRRLILASAKNVTKLRLPSDEQVSRPGYDGVVEVEEGNAWIPKGLSVWEMGVAPSPSTKAERDYAKRNRKPGLRRSTTTFVFVTPRNWLNREKWCRKKARGNKWKAVQALDCSDLAEWLDSVPPVAFWAARLLGKRPRGVHDITAHWQNIRDLSSPKLVPDVFLAGRDSEAKVVTEWLASAPDALFLESDSTDEVIDFFCAFAMSKPADVRVEEARGVIAETREAFRDLSASTTPLILVVSFEIENELIREAVRQGHHVLVAVPQSPQPRQGVRKLRRLPAYELEKALATGTFDFQRAKRIARESGGSSIVLKRLVVSSPPQLPRWASPTVASRLAPFLLVGGWDDGNADDRRIVSGITGLNETEVRAVTREWSHSSDPLFRRKEDTWRLVSRADSWRWLASYLDQRATDEYAKQFPVVIAIDDPRFELKPEERIMATVLGKKLNHSGILRKGMTEAYALLCVSFDTPTEMPVAEVKIRLWELFESVFSSDMTWRRWASLSDALDLFAEARPDAFFDVLERELVKCPPSLSGLFDQEHFLSGSPMTGLMRALEVLGWQSNYLLRVASCLASLSELDPGGNWNPRPFGVLTSFFHPLLPETTASAERRFEVLDEITKAMPDTGWRLLLHLLPKGGGISMYNHQPRWRDWCDGWHRGVRTQTEIEDEYHSIEDRIVSVAGGQPRRLVDLLNHINRFRFSACDRCFDALRNIDAKSIDDPTRESVAKSLAGFINDTKRAKKARWALPKTTIDELQTILDQIQPEDLCLRHRWLFERWPQLPDLSDDAPDQERETAVEKARTYALRELVQCGGVPMIRRLTEESLAAWSVGKTIASAKLLADDVLLPSWLHDSNPKVIEAGQAFARTRFDDEGWTWVQSLETSNWSVQHIASFGLALSFEPMVWDFLKAHSDAAADEYWKGSSGYNRALRFQEHERAIREWLARKRPAPAVELLSHILDDHNPAPTLVLDSLELLSTASVADLQAELASGGFRIEKLIKYVQENPYGDNTRLLAIEWQFLPLLLLAGGSPDTLFAALATQPAFFVGLLGTMYRRTDEREEPVANLTQQEKNRVEFARRLLDEWRVLPGTQPDGSIAETVLRDWAEGVREKAKAQKYEDVADCKLGELFAHAPADTGGVWPCIPLRKIIEDWKSEELESGISCGRFNDYQPGSVTKPIPEKTWDELVQKHRKDADVVAGRWPRTAALLRELAASYEGTARRYKRDRSNDL